MASVDRLEVQVVTRLGRHYLSPQRGTKAGIEVRLQIAWGTVPMAALGKGHTYVSMGPLESVKASLSKRNR